MIVRPTTEQLLLDCCKELMQGVLPAVSDQTAVVRIFMIEQVLRNAAVRCAHEIAWMDEEIPLIDSYARAVLQEVPREELVALLGRLDDAEIGLDLDTVVERYTRAGDVLAAALEIAVTDEPWSYGGAASNSWTRGMPAKQLSWPAGVRPVGEPLAYSTSSRRT